MPDNEKFTINIDTRFRDLDAMGHVNNAVYFTYFEHGRLNFFKQRFDMFEPSELAFFILAHAGCDFKIPLTLYDRISLQVWVSKIGTKSFDFSYKLVNRSDESIVYAKGESVQVSYDYDQKKPVEIPDRFKKQLSLYLQ